VKIKLDENLPDRLVAVLTGLVEIHSQEKARLIQ
jgi:hypothetical protein